MAGFLEPCLVYLGVALIGSDTSSHVSFGSLQRISPALRSWLGWES
jgi:L-lactate permease